MKVLQICSWEGREELFNQQHYRLQLGVEGQGWTQINVEVFDMISAICVQKLIKLGYWLSPNVV
jgi:hypothetical protein